MVAVVVVVVAFTFGMFFEAEGGIPITAEGGGVKGGREGGREEGGRRGERGGEEGECLCKYKC